MLHFDKYEGLGNDFILVDRDEARAAGLGNEKVAALCDRHLGVGADGVLWIGSDGRPSLEITNADGSRPEMCGNGIRCVANYLRTKGLATGDEVSIDTPAGPHRCVFEGEDVAVEMRRPSLVPAEVPLASDAPWLDHPLEVNGRTVHVTAVSMGNPHAVLFDDLGADGVGIAEAIQGLPAFPNGVNVGLAKVDGPDSIALSVLERGAGWTRACGTGACAAAVAAVRTGRVAAKTPITVRLPGGPLRIRVGADNDSPVWMAGPGRFVFSGTLSF